MEVAETIEAVRNLVRAARGDAKTVGLVPTMGALHVGHESLIKRAADETNFVVVSIFVNPTQFAPDEDLEKYPHTFEPDLQMCRRCGADVVFAPAPEQMYPGENLTWVNVEKLTGPLCGQTRPGHFRGVTTVCTKLFNIVMPDIAYFGQKDAQQAIVVKRMAADLNMPLKIVVCPTVREHDGLAVSSRNKYLTDQQRKDAAVIYKSLQRCRELIDGGLRNTEEIIAQMRKILEEVPGIEVEYVSIVDAETLESCDRISGKILAAVAGRIGPARLIDNILVGATK
jgi:pantoate--beta-alanine ligase